MLFSINNFKIYFVIDFPHVFDNLFFYEMHVELEDYKLSDGYFNDLGHMRYANFIQKNIDGGR